ncbi:hypothetical protein Droror1_Dr00001742 [Drosera rotundifolia]
MDTSKLLTKKPMDNVLRKSPVLIDFILYGASLMKNSSFPTLFDVLRLKCCPSEVDLIEEVVAISDAGKFRDLFKKDYMDLCRRISLLAHLVDEIRDFRARRDDDGSPGVGSSSSPLLELLFALQNAKRLLLVAVVGVQFFLLF